MPNPISLEIESRVVERLHKNGDYQFMLDDEKEELSLRYTVLEILKELDKFEDILRK